MLLDQSPRRMVVADHTDSQLEWALTTCIGLLRVHPVGPMPTLPLPSLAGALLARPGNGVESGPPRACALATRSHSRL